MSARFLFAVCQAGAERPLKNEIARDRPGLRFAFSRRGVFRDCRWIVMDANVAPNYTLDTVNGLLSQAGVRPAALILTLKLTDAKRKEQLPAMAQRIRRHGYRRIRMRQLAFNRQEVCAIVTDP